MKIVEAHQIPDGNVSPDIFRLPCVNCANKRYDKGIEYGVFITRGKLFDIYFAYPTEWICKDENGEWLVLDDEEYQAEKGGGV